MSAFVENLFYFIIFIEIGKMKFFVNLNFLHLDKVKAEKA